ncbi:MAG TPA: substrate-binding domain-containing protein, partial [Solirubrobacteraceae bacterium]
MSFQSTLPRRGTVLAALVAACALVAAGCGSDDDSSPSAGSSSSTGQSAGIAQAQAVVKKAEQKPTAITVTKPVGKPIPTGKKLAFISCGVRACELQGDIIKEGAKELGWTSETITTDGSPEKLQAAFNTAMRKGVDGIILNAVDKATVAKQLAEAKKRGIAFVTSSSTDPVDGSSILYNTSTVEQNDRIGEYLAAKAVADSNGK